MKTRVIGIIAALAAMLGLFGIVQVGLASNNAITNRPDDSDNSTLDLDQPAPEPRETETPYVPTGEEAATMDAHDSFLDECMADAGFPEYFSVNVYDEDYVPTEPWDADLSPQRADEAFLAMWGNTGAGADYRWEDAGCAGYATHMIGADTAH